jgi:hypothetical protein
MLDSYVTAAFFFYHHTSDLLFLLLLPHVSIFNNLFIYSSINDNSTRIPQFLCQLCSKKKKVRGVTQDKLNTIFPSPPAFSLETHTIIYSPSSLSLSIVRKQSALKRDVLIKNQSKLVACNKMK